MTTTWRDESSPATTALTLDQIAAAGAETMRYWLPRLGKITATHLAAARMARLIARQVTS